MGIVAERGAAGLSAWREWERRHERREAEVRERFGKVGGFILALTEDAQSTRAWAKGAAGEQRLAALLDPLRDEGISVLHDRRIPGSRANIDHLVVSSAGVFVVDAKNYSGRVEGHDRGIWFSADHRLYVGARDRSTLLASMARQVEAVRAAMGTSTVPAITPVICFVSADWSFFARPLRFGDVHVLWPRALRKLVRAGGPLASDAIDAIEQQLALALPPA